MRQVRSRTKAVRTTPVAARLLKDVAEVERHNLKNPFQNFFETRRVDDLLTLANTNGGTGVLSFGDRMYLHLYSLQLFVHNNLFKKTSPFLTQHVGSYGLTRTQREAVERLADNEDFLAVAELARNETAVFSRPSPVYTHMIVYMKRQTKLYLLFTALERPHIIQSLVPGDYARMIDAFLELGQTTSADMLIQGMLDSGATVTTDLLTVYLEHFHRTGAPFRTFLDKLDELSLFHGVRSEMADRNRMISEYRDEEDDDGDDDDESITSENMSRVSRDLAFFKALLTHCYQRGHADYAEAIEAMMERECVPVDLELFNNKLKMAAAAGEMIDSDVVSRHSTSRVRPNSHTMIALLYSSLVRYEEYAEADSLLKRLRKEWKFTDNQFLISCLAFGRARINRGLASGKTGELVIKQLAKYKDQRPMNHAIVAYAAAYYSQTSDIVIAILADLKPNEIIPPIIDLIVYGNVNRGYGNSKVIENMNLIVKKGTITAVIGPSGCGRLIPDSGTVLVFGREPHERGHTIPGSDVGYAPQETALYDDLSIGETFIFHSTLHVKKSNDGGFKRKVKQVLAIGRRKMTQIYRNKVVLIFELLSPTLQIFLFFIAIGATPKNLNFAMQNAFEQLGESNGIQLNPVSIQPPVYGRTSTTFISFLAPGMIALITFAHSIGITAVSFVREKVDGSLDRIFAVGISAKTILMGHFLAHVFLLLIQTAVLMLLSVFGFHVPIEGNIALVILMLIILGFVGMSLGLVISSIAKIETEAIQLSLATFFPALLLSGVMWPVQAIPKWFIWLSWSLPTTWAAEALRDIMIRGASITFTNVWKAYLIVLSWAVGLMILASLLLQEKESNFSVIRAIKTKLSKKSKQ
eukprot:gene5269-6105_t